MLPSISCIILLIFGKFAWFTSFVVIKVLIGPYIVSPVQHRLGNQMFRCFLRQFHITTIAVISTCYYYTSPSRRHFRMRLGLSNNIIRNSESHLWVLWILRHRHTLIQPLLLPAHFQVPFRVDKLDFQTHLTEFKTSMLFLPLAHSLTVNLPWP